MNKLEQFQKEQSGIGFIKSYPVLNQYTNRDIDIKLIELVLSFQDNGQAFYMRYADIAEILNTSKQTIKDSVCRLKKSGALITTNTKNYNGIAGGSNSTLQVDLDVIISTIEKNKTVETTNTQSEKKNTEVKYDEVKDTPIIVEVQTKEVNQNDDEKPLINELLNYYQNHPKRYDLCGADLRVPTRMIKDFEITTYQEIDAFINDRL